MAISKVGLGWDVGERDYASLNLWLSAKSSSGVYEEAHCKGSCTTATLNITSGFTAGALIYGDIVYDGSNESALAFANHRINNAVANVVIQDLHIAQSNNFTITATANGSGALFKRCRLKHLGTHGTSYGAIQAINGGGAENTVASTVGQRISVHSFNNPLSFVNCLFFGSTNYGVGPIYSAFQTVDKCFSFNNTNEDYFRANPSDSPTDCASEDLTGNVTGYTSAECVDFAAADYRIKNTSDLHALNIGAFFEPSGGGSIAADVDFAMPQFTVSASAEQSAPVSAASVAFLMPQFVAAASAENSAPSIDATVNIAMPQFTNSVSADNVSPVFNAVAAFTMPQFSVSANAESSSPGFGASIAFAMPQFYVVVDAEKTVPIIAASASFTMPKFIVVGSAENSISGNVATVSFAMPQFSVNSIAANTAPEISASIAFTMPQFSVSVFSGAFDYYVSDGAKIVYIAESTEINYTKESTEITYIKESTEIIWRA